jgi:acyl-CoA thioesterase-1
MRKLCLAFALILAPGVVTAQETTIAALGDSLTQGYGLRQADGLVPQLATWLNEEGVRNVRLINAGVSGDTTAGGLSRAAWTLTPDVDAMILTLGGNDLLRGIDPAVSRANLSGILQAAQDANVAVLLIGLTAPKNYGPEYKQAFDAMYVDLAQEYGALYLPSFFAGITGGAALRDTDPSLVIPFMQPDGIHPNPKGVINIVAAIGPSVVELINRTRD